MLSLNKNRGLGSHIQTQYEDQIENGYSNYFMKTYFKLFTCNLLSFFGGQYTQSALLLRASKPPQPCYRTSCNLNSTFTDPDQVSSKPEWTRPRSPHLQPNETDTTLISFSWSSYHDARLCYLHKRIKYPSNKITGILFYLIFKKKSSHTLNCLPMQTMINFSVVISFYENAQYCSRMSFIVLGCPQSTPLPLYQFGRLLLPFYTLGSNKLVTR